MIKNIKFFFILVSVLIIFLILLKGLNNSNKYSTENSSFEINPNLLFKTLYSENEVNLYELTNSDDVYLINIWASWCLPCKDEHHLLMMMKKNKINIIGLNYKDNKSNAKQFIEDLGNPYSEILIDKYGTKSIEFGAIGVPETYLIDSSSNQIIKKIIGPLVQKNYDEILKIITK